MKTENGLEIEQAKKAALDVLIHNAHGPYQGLPRTAGWGYPEPYTRDLMFSIFGIAVSGNQILRNSIRNVLEKLAGNQTERGHIPSLVHDKEDRGASDTTPLFLIGTAIFRKITGEPDFLHEAVDKSLIWMEYQSPSDRCLVAQQPTSDWRDEQWVSGYGLYVNTLVYTYLRLLGKHERADNIFHEMSRFTITGGIMHKHVHEGLVVKHKPYYALWSYKIHSSERFDLLGNSLAILSGLASPSRADEMISWIEEECAEMKKRGELAVDLPPNFFPYIKSEDMDWHARYAFYNKPGDYHNGGIWPFIGGFYVAALVAANRFSLAEEKLVELTHCIKLSHTEGVDFGFNEWIKAQDGKPMGQDWQTWSAALYLYAATCVEEKRTPFFDEIRSSAIEQKKSYGKDKITNEFFYANRERLIEAPHGKPRGISDSKKESCVLLANPAASSGVSEHGIQSEEREKLAEELTIANNELAYQNEEKEKRAEELIIANKELVFQNKEKEKRAAELVLANKELVFQNEEKEKQEAANKELEAFSYSVSHDLRAPLRHIGGFVDLLIKNNSSQLDESGLRYLNIISESYVEMGDIIDALLTFSRLSRAELKRTKINSKNMITRIFKTFNDELVGRNVKINMAELPDIMGDKTLITQVWTNLISNALKYSRNEEKAVIDIGGNIEKDKTTFYIKDNGAGFDMKYAGKLFGVFQRLHKARDFEGIGIGLANVNRIIVRHGGTCWAESEVGKGATFSFSVSNK